MFKGSNWIKSRVFELEKLELEQYVALLKTKISKLETELHDSNAVRACAVLVNWAAIEVVSIERCFIDNIEATVVSHLLDGKIKMLNFRCDRKQHNDLICEYRSFLQGNILIPEQKLMDD